MGSVDEAAATVRKPLGLMISVLNGEEAVALLNEKDCQGALAALDVLVAAAARADRLAEALETIVARHLSDTHGSMDAAIARAALADDGAAG